MVTVPLTRLYVFIVFVAYLANQMSIASTAFLRVLQGSVVPPSSCRCVVLCQVFLMAFDSSHVHWLWPIIPCFYMNVWFVSGWAIIELLRMVAFFDGLCSQVVPKKSQDWNFNLKIQALTLRCLKIITRVHYYS